MNATKFFRYLWRINAVLILLTALIACGLVGFTAINLMFFGRGVAAEAVQVEPEPEAEPEKPDLASFQEVKGAPILRAPLTFGKRFRHKTLSGSGASYSTRNYLFLDLETMEMETRWLFPTNKQLIAESSELNEIVPGDEPGTTKLQTIAFLYVTIDADTNGDKQLTTDDKLTLAYSRPDGTGYTSAITGIDEVLGSETIKDTAKHVVAYEADGKWHTAVISLRTFEVVQEGELDRR